MSWDYLCGKFLGKVWIPEKALQAAEEMLDTDISEEERMELNDIIYEYSVYQSGPIASFVECTKALQDATCPKILEHIADASQAYEIPQVMWLVAIHKKFIELYVEMKVDMSDLQAINQRIANVKTEIARLQKAISAFEKVKPYYETMMHATKEAGTLKRASMDLSRALIELRKWGRLD